MPDLPLSKTLDPCDFDQLAPELAVVDHYFRADAPQHPMRRWEYAMALRAFSRTAPFGTHRYALDVGGAGSPFWRMLQDDPRVRVLTVDPAVPGGATLEQHVRSATGAADAVFALSVLEHVDQLDDFLTALARAVKPGGLVFLTCDYCETNALVPVDCYHFAWMRKRIFNRALLTQVAVVAEGRGLWPYGAQDFRPHGPQVYDYTFASLALRRELACAP